MLVEWVGGCLGERNSACQHIETLPSTLPAASLSQAIANAAPNALTSLWILITAASAVGLAGLGNSAWAVCAHERQGSEAC